MKTLIAGLVSSAIFISGAALAGPRAQPPIDDTQNVTTPAADNTGLIRQRNITATGATVPHPGASQGAGTTPMDIGIERENDRIESICKGC
jgi:hypothetical protein